MHKNKKFITPLLLMFFLVMPASTNYKMKDFGFGTGGADDISSSNYSINAITGEVGDDKLSGSNYNLGLGLVFTNQANVPPAPTFTNPSNYYNKLHSVLVTGNNPSDTKYAIAISTDNFVGDTRYVQNDNTIGATLGAEDYQTYANWGGASGEDIIGLLPNMEYKIKVKAIQGKFTETGYGPVATASTVNPTMSFSISTNSINFGDLTAGSIEDSPTNIVANISTNGENGGKVYIYASNEGLYSTVTSYKIDAVTGDLTGLQEGFGAQEVSSTQTSGGPLTPAALYDQTGNTVGITDQSIRTIFETANPIVGGEGTFMLKAKSSTVTPAASDYGEVLTVIAAASF